MKWCGFCSEWLVSGYVCDRSDCDPYAYVVEAVGRPRGISASSVDRKLAPVFRGLFKYFPDALYEVAAHSYAANEKHNPGEELHWSRDKSADHEDCILRHMLDRAAGIDMDTNLVSVVWRALAALQLEIEEERK